MEMYCSLVSTILIKILTWTSNIVIKHKSSVNITSLPLLKSVAEKIENALKNETIARQKADKSETIPEKDVKPDRQPIVQTQQAGPVKRKFEFDLDSTITPTVTKTARPGLSSASTTKLNEGLKKTLSSTKSTGGLHDSVSTLNLSTTMSVDDQKPLLSDRSDRETITSRAS